MARKTLKRNGYRRRYTRKRGGVDNKLPGIPPKMKLKDFEAQWDVFYIRAHGGLILEEFTVPENTFILHTVPSTIPCTLYVNSEPLDRFYKGNDNTPGYDDEFMEFIHNPRGVFPFIFNKLPSAASLPDVTGIYEPKDKVEDIMLQFASHIVEFKNMKSGGKTHFIVPGIFKIPMSRGVKGERDRTIRDINRKLASGMPSEMLLVELKKANSDFIKIKDNLLKPIIERYSGKNSFLLSKILSEPELQPSAGKKRFVIVHACKSLSGPNNNNTRAVKKLIRQKSINRILDSFLSKELEQVTLGASGASGGPK